MGTWQKGRHEEDADPSHIAAHQAVTPPTTNVESERTPQAVVHERQGSTADAETTRALLKDPMGPKVRPITYVCHLPRITALAREYGYAIAVHGSLQRDLDLIAVPWSEVATDAETLVLAICQTTGGFILPDREGRDPSQKPHGRLAWSIHLGAGLYIDLSVMPRLSNNEVCNRGSEETL